MPKGSTLTCKRCHYGEDPQHPWKQRGDYPPVACPRCHSYAYDKPRLDLLKARKD